MKKYFITAGIVAVLAAMLVCGLKIKDHTEKEAAADREETVYEPAGENSAEEDLADEDPAGEEAVGLTVSGLSEMDDEENRELLETYRVMKEGNPDFAGYLMVDGTGIAYPCMYTPDDPEKYIHMDINGAECEDGLPFIDSRCSLDPDSDNVMIYGHNMKDGSMFASLISYKDEDYFKQHPVIRFDTPDEIREYEVMAAFYDRVYYTDEDVFKFYDFIDAQDEEDYDRAVGIFLGKSLYDTGVRAKYGDKLITLVTCAYHTEDGRFVVVAKRKEK